MKLRISVPMLDMESLEFISTTCIEQGLPFVDRDGIGNMLLKNVKVIQYNGAASLPSHYAFSSTPNSLFRDLVYDHDVSPPARKVPKVGHSARAAWNSATIECRAASDLQSWVLAVARLLAQPQHSKVEADPSGKCIRRACDVHQEFLFDGVHANFECLPSKLLASVADLKSELEGVFKIKPATYIFSDGSAYAAVVFVRPKEEEGSFDLVIRAATPVNSF